MANDNLPPGGQTWDQEELPFSPAVGVHPPAFPMTGGDRFRQLQDDLETRRERIAFEDRYHGPLEEESWNPKPAERKKTIAPAPSRQWVVTVFAALYAEAARNGLTGFASTTNWVVRTAEDRLDAADIDAVPVQLLRNIYLVVSPRQPLQMLWRHRGRAVTMPVNRRGSA